MLSSVLFFEITEYVANVVGTNQSKAPENTLFCDSVGGIGFKELQKQFDFLHMVQKQLHVNTLIIPLDWVSLLVDQEGAAPNQGLDCVK